jgi:hypothetical protein
MTYRVDFDGAALVQLKAYHRPHSMPWYNAWWRWLKSRGTPI